MSKRPRIKRALDISHPDARHTSSFSTRFIPILLIVAVLLVFGRTAGFDFTQWDDYLNVGRNPNLAPPNLAHLAAIWAHPFAGFYIPITYSLWWLLAQMAQVSTPDEWGSALNPDVFHAANILLHLLSVLVVYALARALIGRAWPACAAALFFALHPIQVDSVAWVTGMRDLLAGLLGLVALWQYIGFAKAADPSGPSHKRASAHYAIALAAFIAGMFAKPTVALLPFAAAALDYWVVRRSLRRILVGLVPWLLLAAPVLLAARLIQGAQGVPITPLWSRPLIAGDALAFYLEKVLWPAHLAPDYGRRPIEVLRHSWVYVAWVIPASLGIGAWLLRRRQPWAVATLIVFITPLLPTLGLTPFVFQYFSTVADHYAYLAMLGPALAVGWGVLLLQKRLPPQPLTAACAVVFLLMAARSALQAGVWRDDMTLWEYTLEVNPHSFVARSNIGTELQFRGRVLEAVDQFQAALQDEPAYAMAIKNLIVMDRKLQRNPEAFALGQRLIDANRDTPLAGQLQYSGTFYDLGRAALAAHDPQLALNFFSEFDRLYPDDPEVVEYLKMARKMLRAQAATQSAKPQATTQHN